jgi:uncharacterized RDD family membrane protein YckC
MTPPPVRKPITAGLVAPKTSPTLVDFKNKNTQLPEWRLQIQNAVQQRKGSPAAAQAVSFPTNGSSALIAEPAPVAEKAAETADPLVAKAMNRIAESRKVFSEDRAPHKPAPSPQRPFGVVPANSHAGAATAPARIATPPKPKLVAPQPVFEKRDTNKLPPIADVAQPAPEPVIEKQPLPVESVAADDVVLETPSGRLVHEIKRIQIKPEGTVIEDERAEEAFDDDIEDLAPFSMRFGAGLFDMIIAGFATMLLLSPFAFTNSNWFTAGALLTFTATLGIVAFVYMTLCLGFYGKTMGMRLFSLELVDAVENEYPTLKQAGVNSSLFLVSLAFLGAGFLTAVFNEERRALHDLLSGTILVREF